MLGFRQAGRPPACAGHVGVASGVRTPLQRGSQQPPTWCATSRITSTRRAPNWTCRWLGSLQICNAARTGPPSARAPDKLIEDLETYRDRDGGFETDYWNAVDGARRVLSDRGSAGNRCQAWVWFSDGQYDLDKRDTDAEQEAYGLRKGYGPQIDLVDDAAVERVQDAGVSDLCRRGGEADQMRVQGIETFAIGLGGVTDQGFALMEGVATGSPVGSEQCGGQAEPGSGGFISAENVGELLLAFDRLSDPENLPTQQTTALCTTPSCEQGKQRFTLDGSIDQVRVLGVASSPHIHRRLACPRQQYSRGRLGLAGRAPAGGASITSRALDGGGLELTLDRRQDRGWSGEWSLTFYSAQSPAGATATTNIRLFGDVEPFLLSPTKTEVASGDPLSLRFGLRRTTDDATVPPSSLAGPCRSASFLGPDGSRTDIVSNIDKSTFSAPVDVDLQEVGTGQATIEMSLELHNCRCRRSARHHLGTGLGRSAAGGAAAAELSSRHASG